MRKRTLQALLASLIFVMCAVTCAADSMWDYEVVDSVGYGTHPKVWADETDPNSRIVIEGVALAGYNEILNPATQYTVFLQDDTSDRGGMQAWTGAFFYDPDTWALLRTTDYIDFQAGDRLRITGLIADMGRGKVVINNRAHSGAPNLVWHVDILGHPGLPDPEPNASVSDCNYFDQTRAGGGERWQSRYIMLHGVKITGGTWGNNKLMTIADPTGSVGMLLSATGDFSSYAQPSGKLSVVGIFDQEDDTVSPYTDGYRVWVKRFSDIAAALDACRQVRERVDGDRVALAGKIVSRAYNGFFYVQDPTRAGGIRVNSSRAATPGNRVHVQGLVSTAGGEKAITPSYVWIDADDAPEPLFVNSRALWGEDGLDVNGLLIRIVARIGTDQGSGIFSLTDDAGKTIYVKTNGVTMPSQGTRVGITAVATRSSGSPLLLLAREQDMHTFAQQTSL